MSTRIVGQISLQEGFLEAQAHSIVDALCAAAASTPEVAQSHAGVNSPGSVGGGEITFDLDFESDADCARLLAKSDPGAGLGLLAGLGVEHAALQGAIDGVDAVVVEPLDAQVGVPGLIGVKRTLLLRVEEEATPEQRADFERDMLAMAAYVPAIRNWSFGRVRQTDPCPGPSRWTHVWEQEFETADGLLGDYMASPYHWGYIDSWYDPENPRRVVDPWLAHVFCPATQSVLCW